MFHQARLSSGQIIGKCVPRWYDRQAQRYLVKGDPQVRRFTSGRQLARQTQPPTGKQQAGRLILRSQGCHQIHSTRILLQGQGRLCDG